MASTRTHKRRRREVQEVIETYAGIRSIAWLAKQLELSPRSVQNWIWKLHFRKTDHRGWYTTGQAAQVTGYSPQWMSQCCREGKLRCRRPPRSLRHPNYSWWLVAPEEVERLSKERKPELWDQIRRGI